MNDGSGGRGSGGRGGLVWRWWQRAGVLAIVAGLAMLAAACGSSSSPRPSPGAYSACLRRHGVAGALAAARHTSFPGPGKGVQVPAKVSAAMKACQSLFPPP